MYHWKVVGNGLTIFTLALGIPEASHLCGMSQTQKLARRDKQKSAQRSGVGWHGKLFTFSLDGLTRLVLGWWSVGFWCFPPFFLFPFSLDVLIKLAPSSFPLLHHLTSFFHHTGFTPQRVRSVTGVSDGEIASFYYCARTRGLCLSG